MIRLALLGAILTTPVQAQDKPPITPLRDVDVVYGMAQPTEGDPPASERMRWSTATGRLRVDPPAQDMYMVVDYRAKRMMVVRPSDHAVLDMDAAGPGLPGASASSRFTRQGTDTIAGLACTNWDTLDAAGAPALICMTDDGVMLRASRAGQTLVEAISVTYGPQAAATFDMPAGYRHITPPKP